MSLKKLTYLFLIIVLSSSCSEKEYESKILNNPKKTYVLKNEKGFQLIRNNKPYKIKGAVAFEKIELVSEFGGNSIRTYSTYNADYLFDKADTLGLTVTLGLWLDHIDNFDYSDEKQKARKLRAIKRDVLRYKDEPSLLMWCIGNEFQLYRKSNMEAWKFINEVSKMIHKLDPNHPTTMAIAGYPRKHIPFIKYYCDDLDLWSINKFGEIKSVQEKMKNIFWGYKGAYLLSELGSTGYWDPYLKQNKKMVLEETDQDKAMCFHKLFTNYQKNNQILGSYVFYWGNKQEYTPTWLNLFGRNGEKTAMLEEIKSQWSRRVAGVFPVRIVQFSFSTNENETQYLKPLTNYEIDFKIENEQSDSISIHLELLPESRMVKNSGKEVQPKKIIFDYFILNNKIKFRTPQREGKMRLFMYVRDTKGNVTNRNLTLFSLRE